MTAVEQSGLAIERIDDSNRGDWDAFVTRRPDASAYHRYAWRTIFQRTLRRQSYYLAARDLGEIVGVLPLVRLKSFVFGDFLVSLPYVNQGGILAETRSAERALMSAAAALAGDLGVKHIEFRHAENSHEDLPMRTDKVRMVLPLPGDVDALSSQLKAKVRSQVRRPSKAGATAHTGGIELLDDFYRVFAETMRDLGTPTYSKAFFAAILTTFPGETELIVVRAIDRPVAAGLVLYHNGTLEIPWGAAIEAGKPISANMLLYWQALVQAIARGCTAFDFGRCTKDSGSYNFKKQWGAEPVQLYWHYWLRAGSRPPMISPANPKFRLVINAWKQMPVALANLVGPHIVKNLP